MRLAIARAAAIQSTRGALRHNQGRIAALSVNSDGRSTVSEVDWESLRSLASVLSACCAVIAATVSVLIWRKARSSDLGQKIDEGDRGVKAHADAALNALRNEVGGVSNNLDDMRDAIARIETHQASEEKHVLRPRDLGAIHEKVNRVAEELAATRAQSSVETRMLSEQLRVLQNLVQQQSSGLNRRDYSR